MNNNIESSEMSEKELSSHFGHLEQDAMNIPEPPPKVNTNFFFMILMGTILEVKDTNCLSAFLHNQELLKSSLL